MSGRVAVVGVGDTDYGKDYRTPLGTRQRGVPSERDSYALAVEAFKRALADSGLKKEDIDGLLVNGAPYWRIAEILGLRFNWGADQGGAGYHDVAKATEAINSGRCNTVAIIKTTVQRSVGAAFGGTNQTRSGYMANWYYPPWGFTSPGAQYTMAFQQHMERFGSTEEQLGTVAVTFRKHAMLNENAVMRTPLTIEDYTSSRYICRPFHIYDYCIINDGAVVLILTRADRAKDLPHTPVLVAGLGNYGAGIRHTQFSFRFLDEGWENLKNASDEAFGMAGLGPKDITHFQTYDGYSFHLPMNLEGFGFCKRGEGLDFIQDGRIEIGGELPCNTSGGMLSESYMHGSNHQVEAVRQLRREAGQRQVRGAETSMFCHHGHSGADTVIYRRGN